MKKETDSPKLSGQVLRIKEIYYGGNYRVTLNRDHFRCVICGSEKVVVHRKNGNLQDNHPKNLVTLCRKCRALVIGETKNGERFVFLQKLHQSGMTYEEIAKRLGMTRQRVHQIVNNSKESHKLPLDKTLVK